MNKMNKRGHLALTIVLVALGDAFLGCAGVRDESGGRNMAATTAPYGASLESPTGAPVQATIAMEAISLNKISSMALDPTGQRVYIGAAAEDEKAALLVGTMTATGVAAVQRFRVLDPAVQPATAFTASVTGLVVDATKRKLYASIRYSQPVTANLLTVYDLDSALVPTGAPRNYPASFGSTWAWSIARHPTQPALYTSGWTGVYRHTLNPATGEPTGAAAFFAVAPGAYVTDLAVRGSKLYFGTEVASARLRVVDLDASGAPQLDARGAPVVRSFSFTSPDGCYAPGVGLRFALGANAIYVRPPLRTDATPAIPEFCQLAVWSLQASGEPASAPAFSAAVTMSDVTYSATGAVYLAVPSIALDADLGPMREGMSIARASVDTQGQLAGAPQVVSATDVGARLGLMVAASDNGAAALATLAGGVRTRRPNFDKDWRVRVSLIAADINNQPAAAGTTYSADFTDADQTLQLMPVTVNRFPASPLTVGGAPSGWISLDAFYWNRQTGPILKDKGRLFVFLVNVGAVQNVAGVGGFSRLTVRIDLGRGNAGGGVDVLKSVTDTLQGTIVSFVLPGYAYRTPAGVGGASTLLDAFETLTGHAERLRGIAAEARDAGPSVNTRPQLFPVSCGAIIGNQDSVPMLDALLGTISDLGCNVTLTNYFTGLPVATINERLAANGLKQNLHAGNYFPAQAGGAACGIDSSRAMTYFDFQATPSQLACWASGSATTYAGAYGGQPEDVRLFMLGDEPQFDLPAADPTAFSWVREVASTPELLAKFRTYLQHQVNDPTYFGAANWHDIFPLDPTDPTVAPPSDAGVMSTVTNAADLARHHLAYHTVRYFVEAATNGVRQTSQAIHARFPNALPYVNWNAVSLEWVSNWYTSGKANFDWFEHGRANAGTLWTEDWMTDQRASIWSYYANAMRSAASLGQQEFGGYIVGQTLAYSGVEDGASYRLLGLVGHGAKAVEWYNYGPSLFDDDAWSESIGAYAPIAAANQRLAAAERLLYPGRPSRGAVAIQHSATSNLWDVWQGGTRFPAHYQWETGYLYYALMHAG
ncbi:MAG: hypothetical protein HYY84_16400, partial [Deltaproteobacteria bacterium]|nr:hypothetical protein [Deltaproteobacteria bacterium]